MLAASHTKSGVIAVKLYTAKAISAAFGVPVKEVELLTKQGVIRNGITENGFYKPETTARELIAYYRTPEEEREATDYTVERAKLMKARRISEELDLGIKRGELHKSEDIDRILTQMLISFKSAITAIPSKVAAKTAKLTDPAAIFDVVKELTDEALTELSNYDQLFGTEGEADDADAD